MSAQRYLETIAECDQRLRHRLAHQAWLREQMNACEDTVLGRQTSAVFAARADALKKDIEEAYAALDAQTRKVRHLIDRLPDMKERSALTLRFVDLLPHERAAEAMFVSVRHLFRIQRQALLHLEGLVG